MIPYFDVKKMAKAQKPDQRLTPEQTQDLLASIFRGLISVPKGKEFVTNLNVVLLNDEIFAGLNILMLKNEIEPFILLMRKVKKLAEPFVKERRYMELQMLLMDELTENDFQTVFKTINLLLPPNVKLDVGYGGTLALASTILYGVEGDSYASTWEQESRELASPYRKSGLVTIQVTTKIDLSKADTEQIKQALDMKILPNGQRTIFNYFGR